MTSGNKESKARVLLFHERFAEAVESGRKQQDIRPAVKCAPGDVLSLSAGEGSGQGRQRVLLRARCTSVSTVTIHPVLGIRVDNSIVFPDGIATANGFRDWRDMREWFEEIHGLPFKGNLVTWEPLAGGP